MRCPASHLLGLYNSLSEALGHRTYEASALEEDSLVATLELTVFTGFQKGGISKSLLEAIGRMQVVRMDKTDEKCIFLGGFGKQYFQDGKENYFFR